MLVKILAIFLNFIFFHFFFEKPPKIEDLGFQKSHVLATFWEFGSRVIFFHDFHHFWKAPTLDFAAMASVFLRIFTFSLFWFEGQKIIQK